MAVPVAIFLEIFIFSGSHLLRHHLSNFYWLQYSDGKGWAQTFFLGKMVKVSNFEKEILPCDPASKINPKMEFLVPTPK